jgi:hypothetical protein
MGISGTQKSLMYALGGYARGGATRGGDVPGRAFVFVNGVEVTANIEKGTLTVDDDLNESPNTCDFSLEGVIPQRGHEVIATLGSKNRVKRLFAGHVLRPKTLYLDRSAVGAAVHAVDYTVLLHGILVTGHYVGKSATDILRDLFSATPTGCVRSSAAAAGYSTAKVAANLPTIDEITFTDEPLDDAVSRTMGRISGDWQCDYYRVIRAFLDDEPNEVSPVDLTAAHPTLTDFEYDADDSQAVTRCYVENQGARILGDVAAGDTLIPMDSVDPFRDVTSDVFAKVAFQGSDGAAQHVSFTGVQEGGGGSLVGNAVTPSSSPTPSLASGGGVDEGGHQYAQTFKTAAGETAPSPLSATITTLTIPAPTIAPIVTFDGALRGNDYNAGDTVEYKASFGAAYDSSLESALGTSSGVITVPAAGGGGALAYIQWPLSNLSSAAYSHLWRSVNGGSFKLVSTINNGGVGGTTTWTDAGFGGGIYPGANATLKTVNLNGIALGPGATTARNLWRTPANQPGVANLRLLDTISDNVTTGPYVDIKADSALGIAPPTSDTSGLSNAVVNGGSFITTGATFPTDGAAAGGNGSAPVFTSASYTFVAADVGAYVYIQSGTNWTPGRYLITAVNAGAATLQGPCATVASPTSGTFGVDYSTMPSARIAFTDLVIGGTSTQFTSAAHPVGKNFVGNVLAVNNGPGFTVQRVAILSTSGTTATCDKSLGVASSTGGSGNLGGAADSFVAPGQTAFPLASASGGLASGGWAAIGNGDQVLRYGGISGNTLTGIPATGIGSITAPINYGSTLTFCPMVTGIPSTGTGAIRENLSGGDELYAVVQVDDLANQAILAARYTTATYTDDGVRSLWVQDRRLSIREARVRGQAQVQRDAQGILGVNYTVKDPNSGSGRIVDVNLTLPAANATVTVTGAFKIRHVTISDIALGVDELAADEPSFQSVAQPTYQVEANNQRYTLEDLVRQNRGRL